MLFTARVFHTQPHNPTAQSNSLGCVSKRHACAIPAFPEVALTDSQDRISGCGFFFVLKENLNG
jgi:hypothetical protein